MYVCMFVPHPKNTLFWQNHVSQNASHLYFYNISFSQETISHLSSWLMAHKRGWSSSGLRMQGLWREFDRLWKWRESWSKSVSQQICSAMRDDSSNCFFWWRYFSLSTFVMLLYCCTLDSNRSWCDERTAPLNTHTLLYFCLCQGLHRHNASPDPDPNHRSLTLTKLQRLHQVLNLWNRSHFPIADKSKPTADVCMYYS